MALYKYAYYYYYYEPIATKFCMPGAVHDVITPVIFVKIG